MPDASFAGQQETGDLAHMAYHRLPEVALPSVEMDCTPYAAGVM
nr:hypothetical protein [Cupriavidus sp. KK10]